MKFKLSKYFKGKKILITGHTGFKGSWLTFWMSNLGAKIVGVSKNIPTNPSTFNTLNLKKKCKDLRADISNLKIIKKIIINEKPDFLFHLAAQSLVKKSFKKPIETFSSNTIGTLNILESLKFLKNQCNVVLITSDKSYKNLEKKNGYKESDRLGGSDPYSASKAAAELAIQSYISSYFSKKSNIKITVARAGNVIGGGDWSYDRLIPDCIKSWSKNKTVIIRSPNSTRPWQHVLEALGGYIVLSINLKNKKNLHGEAFNFGPSSNNQKNVISLVKKMSKYWKNIRWKIKKNKKFKETKILNLNCDKAKKLLSWKSVLSFDNNIKMVTDWYKTFYFNRKNIKELSVKQIRYYQNKINYKI